jgi:hypothetical protein
VSYEPASTAMVRAALLVCVGVLLATGCTKNSHSIDHEPPLIEPTPVTLEITHCWVNPVTFEGKTFAVVASDQFGNGDMKADKYSGEGFLLPLQESLIYRDDSGKKLVFKELKASATATPGVHEWCR